MNTNEKRLKIISMASNNPNPETLITINEYTKRCNVTDVLLSVKPYLIRFLTEYQKDNSFFGDGVFSNYNQSFSYDESLIEYANFIFNSIEENDTESEYAKSFYETYMEYNDEDRMFFTKTNVVIAVWLEPLISEKVIKLTDNNYIELDYFIRNGIYAAYDKYDEHFHDNMQFSPDVSIWTIMKGKDVIC